MDCDRSATNFSGICGTGDLEEAFLIVPMRKKPAIRVDAFLARPPGTGGGDVADARKSDADKSVDWPRADFGGDFGGSGDLMGDGLRARSTGFRSGDSCVVSATSTSAAGVVSAVAWFGSVFSTDILFAGNEDTVSSTGREDVPPVPLLPEFDISDTDPFCCSSFTVPGTRRQRRCTVVLFRFGNTVRCRSKIVTTRIPFEQI